MWCKALGIVKLAKESQFCLLPTGLLGENSGKPLTFLSKCKEEGLPRPLLHIQRVQETKGDRSFNPAGTLL